MSAVPLTVAEYTATLKQTGCTDWPARRSPRMAYGQSPPGTSCGEEWSLSNILVFENFTVILGTLAKTSNCTFQQSESLYCQMILTSLGTNGKTNFWELWKKRCCHQKPKYCTLPWLNKRIIQSMRRRNNLFKRANASPNYLQV